MAKLKCDTCGKEMKSPRGKLMHEKYCGNEEAKKALGAKISKGLVRKNGPVKAKTRKTKRTPKDKYVCRYRKKSSGVVHEKMLTLPQIIVTFCNECNGFAGSDMIITCPTTSCPLHDVRLLTYTNKEIKEAVDPCK